MLGLSFSSAEKNNDRQYAVVRGLYPQLSF
jgi:hypothetical protein